MNTSSSFHSSFPIPGYKARGAGSDLPHCGSCDNHCIASRGGSAGCIQGNCVFRCPRGATLTCPCGPRYPGENCCINTQAPCGSCGHDCGPELSAFLLSRMKNQHLQIGNVILLPSLYVLYLV